MKTLRILSIIALALVCILLTVLLSKMFLEEESPAATFPSEEFVDALVDAGYHEFSDSSQEALMEQRKIVVTSSVNARFSRELISKLLILENRSTEEPIDIYIRTEGGWEADIFSVIDVMRSIQAPVNIHAIGEVHSAGLMLMVAATGKRYVYPDAVLGYHCLTEDEEELFLKRYKEFFKRHAKLPDAWLDDHSGEFHYFTAEDALKYEVADEIANVADN